MQFHMDGLRRNNQADLGIHSFSTKLGQENSLYESPLSFLPSYTEMKSPSQRSTDKFNIPSTKISLPASKSVADMNPTTISSPKAEHLEFSAKARNEKFSSSSVGAALFWDGEDTK